MKVEVKRYRANLPAIKRILERERAKEGYDRDKEVAMLASLTGVPIIAILHFYVELFGCDDKLLDSIAKIVKYYGYTEVVA